MAKYIFFLGGMVILFHIALTLKMIKLLTILRKSHPEVEMFSLYTLFRLGSHGVFKELVSKCKKLNTPDANRLIVFLYIDVSVLLLVGLSIGLFGIFSAVNESAG